MLGTAIVVCGFLVGSGGSFGHETPLNEKHVKELSQEMIKEAQILFAEGQVSALSLAVFTDQSVVFSKGFGYHQFEGNRAVSPQTSQFRLGSISKLFTSVAIARLMEKGVLQPETPVMDLDDVQFVRFLKSHETPERLKLWQKVTIHHMLTHTAGISKDLPGARVFWESRALEDSSLPTLEDMYQGLLSVEFLFEPGQTEGAIKYSNLGMNLLARIVEDLNPERLSFQEFVQTTLFAPLGMQDSLYDLKESSERNVVTGYGIKQDDGRPLVIPVIKKAGSYDGSIGASSSAGDLAKFGQHLLRASRLENNGLFSEARFSQYFLTPPEKNIFMTKGRVMGPGFFWRFRPLESETIDSLWLGHTGLDYGSETILLVNPYLNVGVVILVNSSAPNPAFKLWDAIVKKLEGMPGGVSAESQRMLHRVRSRLAAAEGQVRFSEIVGQTVSKEQLERFVGSYFADNSINGPRKEVILIVNDSGQPELRFVLNERVQFRLFPENIDAGMFRMARMADVLFNGEPAQFEFDEDGRVISLVLAQVKELQSLKP